MLQIEIKDNRLIGPGGTLPIYQMDEVTRKLVMLIEGECGEAGPLQAARKFGYSKQRYYQVLHAFREQGVEGLKNRKRGPKTNYRRTEEVERMIIQYRFLDPNLSGPVIAQKLKQQGHPISIRSVERVLAKYNLQKKTPPTAKPNRGDRVPSHKTQGAN